MVCLSPLVRGLVAGLVVSMAATTGLAQVAVASRERIQYPHSSEATPASDGLQLRFDKLDPVASLAHAKRMPASGPAGGARAAALWSLGQALEESGHELLALEAYQEILDRHRRVEIPEAPVSPWYYADDAAVRIRWIRGDRDWLSRDAAELSRAIRAATAGGDWTRLERLLPPDVVFGPREACSDGYLSRNELLRRLKAAWPGSGHLVVGDVSPLDGEAYELTTSGWTGEHPTFCFGLHSTRAGWEVGVLSYDDSDRKLMRVVGVPAGKRLMLRSEPVFRKDGRNIEATIPHDARGLVPLGKSQGDFVQIRYGTRSGWVHRDHLAPE